MVGGVKSHFSLKNANFFQKKLTFLRKNLSARGHSCPLDMPMLFSKKLYVVQFNASILKSTIKIPTIKVCKTYSLEIFWEHPNVMHSEHCSCWYTKSHLLLLDLHMRQDWHFRPPTQSRVSILGYEIRIRMNLGILPHVGYFLKWNKQHYLKFKRITDTTKILSHILKIKIYIRFDLNLTFISVFS